MVELVRLYSKQEAEAAVCVREERGIIAATS